MGKKFVGLDGLKHFWTKAKTWITGQITAEVTAKIAEIVANAPEDLDTLKEIADWIKTHANDASAMNTQINTNKSDISALKTSVAGKADTGHTHTKSQITDFPTSLKNPNALTVNGKTYDGSSAVNAGVQTVANGGTGQTTANAAANSFINSLTTGGSVPEDNDYYVCQWAGGGTTTTTYHRIPVSKLWEYIKGKISSVLGLTATNYGGKASTAGTAEHAATADAFSTTYISNITPAQAAAMKSGSTIWPLRYNKDYLQTVSVSWDDYSSHTFPAGAAGMFFPGYSSNGGTLILIIYGSSRMLYNVWIDSNRWSGWHYIDLPAISYT